MENYHLIVIPVPVLLDAHVTSLSDIHPCAIARINLSNHRTTSMRTFTYTVKDGRYLYQGPGGHGGIAYSLEHIHQDLIKRYGAGNYSLEPAQ